MLELLQLLLVGGGVDAVAPSLGLVETMGGEARALVAQPNLLRFADEAEMVARANAPGLRLRPRRTLVVAPRVHDRVELHHVWLQVEGEELVVRE